jgi:REP element-mobilizing transposase RayT
MYHAMARGIRGVQAFPGDEHREKFLELLGQRVEAGDLVVHAFCLMTTHFHLLVGTPRGSLSRWMQGLTGSYAQWRNIRDKRSGHFWQGRYKAIVVEPGNYLLECSRYIHLNPNRAGLSRPAERWKWSSYRNYVSGIGTPAVPWVTTDTVLGELGTSGISKKEARRAYREYVESAKGEPPIEPFDRAAAGLALGSESFVAWVKDKLKRRAANREEPALRRLRALGLETPEKIEALVKAEFGDTGDKGRARNVLAAFLVSRSGLRPAEVARRLGVSPSAITRSVLRIDQAAAKDPKFARRLRTVSSNLLMKNQSGHEA